MNCVFIYPQSRWMCVCVLLHVELPSRDEMLTQSPWKQPQENLLSSIWLVSCHILSHHSSSNMMLSQNISSEARCFSYTLCRYFLAVDPLTTRRLKIRCEFLVAKAARRWRLYNTKELTNLRMRCQLQIHEPRCLHWGLHISTEDYQYSGVPIPWISPN